MSCIWCHTDTTQIASIIMAGGTLIAYIVGEGLVDASSVNETKTKGGE